MQTPRISKERQQRFLKALAETGSPGAAAAAAGVELAVMEQLRASDAEFGAQWTAAVAVFDQMLDHEIYRRAVAGVQEPLVSDGKVVRDDNGRPVAVKRYSDLLLLALAMAHHPETCATVVRALLPPWFKGLTVAFVVAFIVWLIGDCAMRLIRLAV